MTLGAYAVGWTRDTALRVKPSTLEFYRHSLKHIKPIAGLPITAVTPQHIRDLMAEKSEAGLGNRTIRGFVQTLGYVLGQAEADGIVDRNVAKLVRLPPNDTKEPRHFTVGQMRRFLEVAKDDELGSLYLLGLGTGLRRGELLALTWAEVDLDEDRLRVRRSKSAAGVREVPLPVFAASALRAMARHPGPIWDVRPEYVTRHCAELCDRAGVPRLTPHGLRHTWFTLLAELDVSEEVRQWLGGHSDKKMTRHYSHESERLMREAVERLGKAVSA